MRRQIVVSNKSAMRHEAWGMSYKKGAVGTENKSTTPKWQQRLHSNSEDGKYLKKKLIQKSQQKVKNFHSNPLKQNK